MGTEAVSYSIPLPARTLRAVPASSSGQQSQWIVGTTSLREENEVCVLEYDGAHDRLSTAASWVHPEEVWDVACCPGRPNTFVTVHRKCGQSAVTLWQAGASHTQLQPAAQLRHESPAHRVLWGQVDPSKVTTVEDGALRVWDVAAGTAQQVSAADAPAALSHFWTAALHPKDPHLALVAGGSSVQLWDTHTNMSGTGAPVAAGRKLPVRDVCWAPHNEHRFVTGGDDGKLRFWDTRLLGGSAGPLLELSGHSHWVWQVAYSPFHDPLVLSSSTDTTVCLWFTPALAKANGPDSKAAVGRTGGSSGRQDITDGKAHTLDDHEDSVYGLAWSTVDPWLFASMSYDGRLLANRVPKNVKYKILI